MTRRVSWRDAEAAAKSLSDADRRLLLLLVRLPFSSVKLLAQLNGLSGAASVYRTLNRLRETGAVGALQSPFRSGHTASLLYLTDLGLATLAVAEGVEPRGLARRARIRGQDLLDLFPGLPHLVACYELLSALAASQAGQPDLLAWERPWRRRYRPGTAKSLSRVEVPAYAAFAWGALSAEYLLIPDLGLVALNTYRPLLNRLLAWRRAQAGRLPPLLVAAPHAGRVEGWRWLLKDVSRGQREAVLTVVVTTWDQVHTGKLDVSPCSGQRRLQAEGLVQRLQAPAIQPRPSGRPIPGLVDGRLAAGAKGAGQRRGGIARELTATDRSLLDFLGRHPFLSALDIATVMNWSLTWATTRLDRLLTLELLRYVEREEVGEEVAAAGLVELTAAGVVLAAAHQGLSVSAAIRHTGLVGGGADHPFGSRANLVQNFAHTWGVHALFMGLYRTAQRFRARGSNDAVVEWWNAATCAERMIRPDAYGVYRHAGVSFGFFLEYDRGTMNTRDYRAKFSRYYTYRDRYLFKRQYTGMPTILVVTTDPTVENRIAHAAYTVGVGRKPPLHILLTCEWRIHDPHNPSALLGRIWRKPVPYCDEREFLSQIWATERGERQGNAREVTGR
ncbi:MAG: replication-relaxation family protein [Anaerolineae bacterium]|nr:replication-relaxation family protein [Anaerolineae bacterium]